jgi:hypothetical protein
MVSKKDNMEEQSIMKLIKLCKVTIIIFLLICSHFIIIIDISSSNKNVDEDCSTTFDLDSNELKYQLLPNDYHTRASLHTNDWIDTFEDYSGVETHSDLNISSGQAKLELDYENLVFSDDFSSTQLDNNKWNGQIDGGTQLVPSPTLMALKQNEVQTQDIYIETSEYWSLERVVEWKWNSVLEGGYGTYDHVIYAYNSALNNIWVKIQGDRRVILGTNSDKTSDPVYTIFENRWYQMQCKISSTNVVLTICNETGTLLNVQTIEHQISGNGNFKILFASKSTTQASFDVRVDDITIKGGYKTSASLTSVPTTIPQNKRWDTLGLSKSEPINTMIRISILNADNNQPLQGFEDLSDNYFDISTIDPAVYPSLKLFATLDSTSITSTPVLFQWGISWIGKNMWQDTFLGASKIESLTNVIVEDGEVVLEESQIEGLIISNPIYLIGNHFWDSIVIEKSESSSTSIKITVLDYYSNSAITVFDSPATLINIFSIDPLSHPVIKLKAKFIGTDIDSPVLYRWNLNWSVNTLPEIVSFQTQDMVYRTATAEMFAKCSDNENPENDLNLQFQYKSPADVYWQTNYFTNLKYYNNYWVVDFTPGKNAVIGNYSIKLICMDKFGGSCYKFFNSSINVLNNKPNKPEIQIEPLTPTSASNLECEVLNITDIDNDIISYKFEWYKDNVLQPGLTSGSVPAGYTSKNEVWKCKVTPNDGVEDGEPATKEVYIHNTPPEAINPPARIYINEDVVDSTSLNLSKLFVDRDGDNLKFFKSGDINIGVTIISETGQVILKPDQDWNGNENIIFIINDSRSEIEYSLIVSVISVNDPPVIEKVNNILVSNRDDLTVIADIGQELIFDIKAYDIDSESFEYSFKLENNSGRTPDNLILNENTGEIWFKPTSDDVGILSINVTVSDNKGEIDWKVIKIKVLEDKNPWYEFDFQTLLIMGVVVLLIIVLISGFLFFEWRNIKKRKEAEFKKAQKSEDKYQPDQKQYSTVELLKILNWRYSRHEIDKKTYKELKKSIMEMKGDSVQVNLISSPLFAAEPEVPGPEPALTPPPVITEPSQQFVQHFDLPKLPPAPDPDDD